MFTGIVQTIGQVLDRKDSESGASLAIGGIPEDWQLRIGDSICVQGVCLTVVSIGSGQVRVDVVGQTLSRTTIGDWDEGTRVNLEPSLAVGHPIGGHWVFGHVDGVGDVLSVNREGAGGRLTVALPADVAGLTVPRGSLALNGVSLTVAELVGREATFAIVPHTWSHTTLGQASEGTELNVEADAIGRHVARSLEAYAEAREARLHDTFGP